MARFAQVIIDISLRELDRPFTYRIPEELEERLRIGSYVVVPFGSGDVMRKGYVIAFADTCELPEKKLKDIADVKREGPDETGAYAIRLAAWMQHRYGSTMAAALKTVLTGRPQVRPIETKSVRLLLNDEAAKEQLAIYDQKHQVARARVLRGLLTSHIQPYTLITQKLHASPNTLRAMEKAGVLRIETRQSLRNPVAVEAPEERRLILSPQQEAIVDGVLADFHALQRGDTDPLEHEPTAFPVSGADSTERADADSGRDAEAAGKEDRAHGVSKAGLTHRAVSGARRVSLIHGITGSGKTEVYIRIIERIVSEGRHSIMLIPEIALTYQTLLRFYRHFGDRVSVMNSTLSEGEKSDQFERARRGEIDVIIGPRSALFTPFPRIGVIVIDEEHETSYKNEQMPKYHARETAIEIARMHEAVVVLGSATPSMDSYDRAVRGEYRLYRLQRRLTGQEYGPHHDAEAAHGCMDPGGSDESVRETAGLPSVEIADMRRELREGNRSILSRRLSGLVADRLERGEQTMLFLNRRGFSGFVSCRNCGYVPKCPHCSVSLSLHTGSSMHMQYVPSAAGTDSRRDASFAGEGTGTGASPRPGAEGAGILVCHYCGYRESMPQTCPECGSSYISGFRAGTEQVESMLRTSFPGARILRMDADTTRTKGSYEQILSKFANEEADILIGTQMIVKGHDFPNVTLMGVLLADMSLYANDYRAAERTFQLLTQAAGRAGRGSRPGEVVIQTYEPEHYAIIHAAHQDYEAFYREEIAYRRILRYPPAEHMLAVQIISKNEDHAQLFAGQTRLLLEKLRDRMRPRAPFVEAPAAGVSKPDEGCGEEELLIIGPAAASLEKLRDEYRYAVYIKSPDYAKLIACKDGVEAAAARSRDAMPEMDTYFQFDFDPVNPY